MQITEANKANLIPPEDGFSSNIYKSSRKSRFDKISNFNTEKNESGLSPSNNRSQSNEDKGNKEVINNIEETKEASKKKPICTMKLLKVLNNAHQGWVRSCSVDPVTNKWFATGSTDSTIKIWNLANLKLKATLTGHILAVRSLVVSDRHPYLFSGSEDKTVRCWDLERTNSSSGSQIRDYHGHVGGVYTMALHPELDLLFTGGRDAVIRVWDIRTRAEVMVLTGHRSDISSVVSQLGDPQVISSSMDSTIRLWDLRKSTTQMTLAQHTKSIRSMIMHPKELTFCSGDSSGNIKEWVLPHGDLLNSFGLGDGIINSLSLNYTNNILFSGYNDGKMEFYDYISGDLLQSTYTKSMEGEEESAIYASAFDNSGLRLLTCEGDKSVKVWG